MGKKKESKVNKGKKNISKEMYDAVPNEVKVAFGKFYLFSLIYLIFFFGIYPFLIIGNINDFVSGLVFGFLVVFYIYMIVDTRKRTKTFASTYYYLLIFLVMLAMSFSIVKFFI